MDSDKYVAMDVHKASVVIGIRDAVGKYIMESVVETKAATLLDFVKGLSGTIHLTFEEGTHSAWLYDLLKPHVAELVVCNPRRNKLLEDGNKADVIDVQKLSQLFRAGLLHPVYHGDHGTRALKELAQNYESLVSDRVRVKNRLKAIYRGRGISCDGAEVYQRKHRARWLAQLTESGVRRRAESLYQQLESLEPSVTAAQKTDALREPEAEEHESPATDADVGTNLVSIDRGHGGHAISVSHQAAVLGLLWLGRGHALERRLLV